MKVWLLVAVSLTGLPAMAAAQPKPLFEDQQAPVQPQSPSGISPAPEITIRELDAPNPDAAGVDLAADQPSPWGQTPPATIQRLLEELPADPADATMRQLQIELLQMPTPESQPSGLLLAFRAQGLLQLGMSEQARMLLEDAGPAAASSAIVAPVAAHLDLVAGRDVDACALARATVPAEPALSEINLFCTLQDGDLDTASVLYGALGETETLRVQPFAALVNVALGYGNREDIDWSAQAQPVDVALAGRLGIDVPERAVDVSGIPVIERLAGDPRTAPTVRAAARARLQQAKGDVVTTGAEATRLRTIADPVARARAVAALWHETGDPAERLAYLPQLAPIAATIAPRAALSQEATTLAAILTSSGQEGAALTWFEMLETQGQGSRREADRAAVLMILSGLVDPSRMPASPAGLFSEDDQRWIAGGIAGQGVNLSSPWMITLGTLAPLPAGPPAMAIARALVELTSDDPAMFAQGLQALILQDRALDARDIARRVVIARIDG